MLSAFYATVHRSHSTHLMGKITVARLRCSLVVSNGLYSLLLALCAFGVGVGDVCVCVCMCRSV